MSAAAFALVLQIAVTPPPEGCEHDRQALFAMPADEFDSRQIVGWRSLANRPECLATAADLLRDYREARRASLDINQLHLNYWHEGQLRAGLGQTESAIHLMMAGVNPGVTSDGFADYALASIAFLNRDLEGLKAARDRLAATPPTADWEKSAAEFRERFGREITWPMNLNVVDGLIACFDKPYFEAYGSATCRP